MYYKLSATKLNLLQECPRCFWLAVIKKIERPSWPPASIVMKMDSIIKHYFDRYRIKGQLPPLINHINGRLPVGIPKTLTHKENESVILIGKPDEYIEIDESFIVPLDHKTKSKPPVENHPAHLLQLDVYSFLLYRNKYKTRNKAFLAYYYPEYSELHKGMDIHCKLVEVTTNPGRVKGLLEKAQKILEGYIPEGSEGCEYCKWRRKTSGL